MIKDAMQFLTQIQPPRNHQNIESLNKVASHIKEKFELYGLQTQYQTYEANGNTYKNVIGVLNPQYEKTLVIGGHYDVCGDLQGADDNASAVAGVIDTARQLSLSKEQLNFKIEFVAFTLEEPPHFGLKTMGSFVHAKSLKDNDRDVIGMINYEMIGYFADEPNSQDYPIEFMKDIYPTTGNFIANVSNTASKEFLAKFDFGNVNKKIESFDIVLPEPFSLITASDHLNYWQLGFNAIMITDTAHFRNPNYHKDTDTIDTINFEYMQYSIDMVVNGIRNLNI